MRRRVEATDAALVTPEIEALADAVRGDVEPEGVGRALTAFRVAGRAAEGVAPRRGRRRDDWRPARRRFAALVSWRAALGAALATVALGGLALAAVPGVLADPPRPADAPVGSLTPRPGGDAPRTPGGTPEATRRNTSSPAASASASAHDPVPRSHAALCHAWSRGNGKHRGTAFQQLADAAGGEGAVDAYCATLSGTEEDVPPAPKKPGRTDAPGQLKSPPAASPSRGRSSENAQGTGKQAS
ncbi:hypothetical protein P3L51_05630 [Streptomyces sp. PSRA5]|uniref:hypothetical protein n=1 Tax=Streptomyces panacea TaxID=3035064 RepID=UPI00339C1BBD